MRNVLKGTVVLYALYAQTPLTDMNGPAVGNLKVKHSDVKVHCVEHPAILIPLRPWVMQIRIEAVKASAIVVLVPSCSNCSDAFEELVTCTISDLRNNKHIARISTLQCV